MRTCEWCGGSVNTRRANIRYCSTAHRVAAHRAQKRMGHIPAVMFNSPRWVNYSPTKTPLNPRTGHHASSTDPRTWASHATAAQSRYGVGIGYVLGQGVGCIDLDHCVSDGELSQPAQDLIAQYPHNWVELSPSGHGLHVWGTADEQPGWKKTINGLHIEFYTQGRYITVTGNTYQAGTLQPL